MVVAVPSIQCQPVTPPLRYLRQPVTNITGQELSLSYNGNGPVTCQVLAGLTYDPSSGGTVFVLIPNALSGIWVDFRL